MKWVGIQVGIFQREFFLEPRKKLTLRMVSQNHKLSQLTFTCSKSTIEALEKGVKYVQSYQ